MKSQSHLPTAISHALKHPRSPGFKAEILLFRWIALGALLLLLAGCCKPQIVRVPGPVEYRDRLVVQPVEPRLLETHPIPHGKVSECPAVASERKRLLQECYNSLQIIKESR